MRVQCTHLVTEWKKCYFGGLPPLGLLARAGFLSGFSAKGGTQCSEQAEMNKVRFETNNAGSARESFPKPVTFSSCSLLKHRAGAIKLLATGG